MYLLTRLLTCIDIFCSSYAVISLLLCFLRPLVRDLEHTRQNQSHGVLCCVLVHSEEGVTLSTSCGGVSYLVFFGTGNRNQLWRFLEEARVLQNPRTGMHVGPSSLFLLLLGLSVCFILLSAHTGFLYFLLTPHGGTWLPVASEFYLLQF